MSIAESAASTPQSATSEKAKSAVYAKIAGLLERNGIDVEDIGGVQKVKLYQGFYKDNDGEAHTVDMSGIELSPTWAEGPKWPVIQPAAPVKVYPPKSTPRSKTKWKTCIVLPDPQIGFRRDIETGELDPFHDEAAMSVALKICLAMQPDLIVNLGDTLDLPEMSSFRKEAGFALTTQPALNRAHLWLAQQRAYVPCAEIRLIEGNHDRRLLNYITDNARAAFGLRQANPTPQAWPVFSVPHLLHLDALNVSYIEGWPAGITYINDRLACVHGERLKLSQVVEEERISIVQGHTHHCARASKTRRTANGARTTLAVSPGCLCRIDGAVPSTKGSTDSRGRAIMRPEDWTQGVCVVRYIEGDGPFAVQIHDIIDGWALIDGVEYVA